MKRRSYEAFTLVEMLIVMGILIILMVIGITAGRFAINRANDVAHQNAADQIYQGLQAYYTDNREFPYQDEAGADYNVETLLGTVGDEDSGPLNRYLDTGAFKGGTEATYYYFVEVGQQQSVLVCVSLGGERDARERGIYCTGNGFGDAELTVGGSTGADITDKMIPYAEDGVHNSIIEAGGVNWTGSAWE